MKTRNDCTRIIPCQPHSSRRYFCRTLYVSCPFIYLLRRSSLCVAPHVPSPFAGALMQISSDSLLCSQTPTLEGHIAIFLFSLNEFQRVWRGCSQPSPWSFQPSLVCMALNSPLCILAGNEGCQNLLASVLLGLFKPESWCTSTQKIFTSVSGVKS